MLDNIEIRTEIFRLVSDIAQSKYDAIEKDGRSGRLSAIEIKEAIIEYGRTVIELPPQGLVIADAIKIKDSPNDWMIDIQLWTKEEGMGDLTLSLSISIDPITISIEDIHVL